jgi:hypothetical protein
VILVEKICLYLTINKQTTTNKPIMAKETMKSRVLNFVESQGSARYTDIIRFIVDYKFGPGAYDNTRIHNPWNLGKAENPYRGYYSTSMMPDGYLRNGRERLVKGADGLYTVERQA